MKDKVSIIIPNYNYGSYIKEAIESALSQTYNPLEVIVVDDGSTDDSLNIIKSFGSKIKFISQKNSGVGKARNTGAAASDGKYLAFLDADDIWFPEKVARQVEIFESDKEIGLVTCGMQEFDNAGNILATYTEGEQGWCTESLLLIKPTTIGPGTTAMVRRDIFEKIGGFDETKEMHPSEDWEFSYRVSLISKLAVINEVLVNYRNHGKNGHLRIPKFEHSMNLAFEKTFRSIPPKFENLKTKAYGNLHTILAGSYFHIGDYSKFVEHSIKSFRLSPSNIIYFLKFPVRKIRKSV